MDWPEKILYVADLRGVRCMETFDFIVEQNKIQPMYSTCKVFQSNAVRSCNHNSTGSELGLLEDPKLREPRTL